MVVGAGERVVRVVPARPVVVVCCVVGVGDEVVAEVCDYDEVGYGIDLFWVYDVGFWL